MVILAMLEQPKVCCLLSLQVKAEDKSCIRFNHYHFSVQKKKKQLLSLLEDDSDSSMFFFFFDESDSCMLATHINSISKNVWISNMKASVTVPHFPVIEID